ncbi:Exopolyphosphatase [Lutibaculum baratangense AMV1]|uniref:Exopolyphosphatase n=1 Tax=Lutibaculum baratangense AMV1 TaxID=631454 RepID=V4RDR6_9HYPH|nr:Exopolyphosphatase [Lutibaculum baratangense AMV1]
MRAAEQAAPGRLPGLRPVGVVDIGSNSVRLVVYEGLSRSPTPLFNEKVLCGLGRHVASKGILDEDAIDKALTALRRFKALANCLEVQSLHVIATAAAREASNGPAFVEACERICGTEVRVLTGPEEAELSAFGVLAGMHRPAGLVGDMGGGSLEIVDIDAQHIGEGATMPLGGLRLMDVAGRSLKKAEKFVSDTFDAMPDLAAGRDRDFYAIGGTFRALARLHMAQSGYTLHVMHGYTIPAQAAIEFCGLVKSEKPGTLGGISAVSEARQGLLPYGAIVLEQLLRRAEPNRVVISAYGVREGLLYTLLPEFERQQDPLLVACAQLGYLRSRSPDAGEELFEWTSMLFEQAGLDETPEERRLRHAACLVVDIGWRAHPDYRGEQSLNILANASLSGIDHPGRAFLSLAIYYRYAGLVSDEMSPQIRELASPRLLHRARVLGGAMRVALLLCGGMSGILSHTPIRLENEVLTLSLDGEAAALAGSRVETRLKNLAKLLSCRWAIEAPPE